MTPTTIPPEILERTEKNRAAGKGRDYSFTYEQDVGHNFIYTLFTLPYLNRTSTSTAGSV